MPEQKAIVVKYATEHGIVKAIRCFVKEFGNTLKESIIQGWREAYLQELHVGKESGENVVVSTRRMDAH